MFKTRYDGKTADQVLSLMARYYEQKIQEQKRAGSVRSEPL